MFVGLVLQLVAQLTQSFDDPGAGSGQLFIPPHQLSPGRDVTWLLKTTDFYCYWSGKQGLGRYRDDLAVLVAKYIVQSGFFQHRV